MALPSDPRWEDPTVEVLEQLYREAETAWRAYLNTLTADAGRVAEQGRVGVFLGTYPLTRAALAIERHSSRLVDLTWALVGLTIALSALTAVLVLRLFW
ncbi:MAG TPA: hypothetical protein VFF67_09945 [Thermoplasmata archaeon]|nr:hypothetical protein [Thermoplasmata archaeon]